MTLYFNGHAFKHKLESICKMFFPCQKIALSYDSYDYGAEDIITRRKKGKWTTSLLCIYKGFAKRYSLSNEADNYEKLCERLLCKALYRVVSQALDTSLQWGILTGIRPVKLVNQMKQSGKSEKWIRRHLQSEFLASEEKIELSLEISRNQELILSKMDSRGFSLYVSIPFCPTRCAYCSFVSHSIGTRGGQELIAPYIEKVCEELRVTADIVKQQGLRLETIYFGGGTPTAISAEQLKIITDCINENFDNRFLQEYTVEAGRPDTITAEKLAVLKEAGVTRISINPQTFNEKALEGAKRMHTGQETIEAYQLARGFGFDSINMDLIAGLPHDTFDGFAESLQTTLDLEPENVTVHVLSFKRASDFYTLDGVPESIDAEVGKMLSFAKKTLQHSGYSPYYMYRQKNMVGNLENTGYAKSSCEGLYNIYIMEENHTILSVGANGVTKLVADTGQEIRRIFNYKFPYEYIRQFGEILQRKEQVREFYERTNSH